jgi:hypothetical protein
VYGLLAVCAGLVLVTRPGDEPAEVLVLEGSTSKRLPVTLRFVDGELQSLETRASIYCPRQRFWSDIPWRLIVNFDGHFHQDGSRSRVRERDEFGDDGTSNGEDVTAFVMRGRLDEEAESARGTISAHYRSGRSDCEATVRFRAG